ncbi:MAG: hypothetical protein WCI31_06155 [Prolixibacteraceae bacterium]
MSEKNVPNKSVTAVPTNKPGVPPKIGLNSMPTYQNPPPPPPPKKK